MKINHFFLASLIFILLLSFGYSYAQKYPELNTKSAKARKYYMEAMNAFRLQNFDIAVSKLDKCIEYDSLFIEAWFLMGDAQSIRKQNDQAIIAYKTALKINPEFFPNAWFLLANIQLLSGRYSDAYDSYDKTLRFNKYYEKDKVKLINERLDKCEFGIYNLAHPVPFNPQNLGDSVNSKDDEYVNAVTADEELLYITYKGPRFSNEYKVFRQEEDFYFSRKSAGKWGKVINVGEPVNTPGNEGALCISADGMDMYFAGCNRPEGKGSCDLYHALRMGNFWSVPQNMGTVINSANWDTQPSIAPDGKTIYFVSNRPEGKSNSDIYVAKMDNNGNWGEAVNLGDSINSPMMEMNPFIHADGKTLYFASEGHMGMGGFDLFVSRMKPDGTWTKPRNLGYPINTFADEVNFIVNARGNLAFFSSDKLGGLGRNDIYCFELYSDIRPEMVSYVKGLVFNNQDKKPLIADFELIDLNSGKVIVRSHSEPVNGEFMLTLPPKRDYALHVSCPGYLFYSENFSLTDVTYADKPYLINIPLQPVKAGEIVVLKNVFFETDRFELLPGSKIELDKLIQLLKINQEMKIEVSGHTDNQGTDEHNMDLSSNRARVVYEYLLAGGIPPTRLSFKGYGEKQPLADNTTEDGRKQNRRTEFKVLN